MKYVVGGFVIGCLFLLLLYNIFLPEIVKGKCSDNITKSQQTRISMARTLMLVTAADGHDYVVCNAGGIVHSAGCKLCSTSLADTLIRKF